MPGSPNTSGGLCVPASERYWFLGFYAVNDFYDIKSSRSYAFSMNWQDLIDRVHDLSDLELAALLCLIAKEHCIVETDPDSLDDLEQELQLVRHV